MQITDREPLDLAPEEDLDLYADTFGLPRAMVRLAHKCPECEAAILVPNNGVWLDAKPTDEDGPLVMGVMQIGRLQMACSVDPGERSGSHHTMHEHQPPEH